MKEFTVAVSLISLRQSRFVTLIPHFGSESVKYSSGFTFAQIKAISDELDDWGRAQNIKEALSNMRALSTDSIGARPLWHLAALAMAGDVTRLRSYQASFEAGDRLGFVPYITKDYIDRAVSMAEEYAGNV